MFQYQIRPYQAEAITAVSEAISAGERRICLQLPTGAGKTIVASYLMDQYSRMGYSVGFMVERRNLVEQASDRLRACGVPHGIFMAGHEHYSQEPVQVISRDTLHERCFRTQRLTKPPIDILFRDECHMGVAPSDLEIYDGYPDMSLVGITATPARGDGTGLGHVFTKLIQPRTFQQLIDEKWLVPNMIYQPRSFDASRLQIANGEFRMNEEAGDEVLSQNPIGNVISDWRNLSGGRPTICFCPTIAKANWVAEHFSKAGIPAASVTMHTDQAEREAIYVRSSEGALKIITSVEVLSRGADLPWIGCVIHLRPFRSVVPWIQACGRANRPFDGKSYAVQIDHVGNVSRLGFPEDVEQWSLTPGESPAKLRENRDSEPAICGACKAAKPEPGKCQACGHEPEGAADEREKIEFEPGTLVRARRKRAVLTDEERVWKKCLGIAIYRRTTMSWARWLYRKKTGAKEAPNLPGVPDSWHKWGMPALDYYNRFLKKKA